MKTVNDPDFVVTTKELFAAGGALYHMAAQLMVLQTLSKHPKDWAAKHRKTPEVAPFKANPTPEGLRQYLETMLLRQTPSSTTSSSGVDIWSSNEPGTTTQRPPATVVWNQVDNEQQPRLLRPQSIWEADNERPGASAQPELEEEEYEEENAEEQQDQERIPPPKRRARSDPFKGIDQEITEHEEWEFSEDSSEERELMLAQEDPDPPQRSRTFFTRTLPATVTVSLTKKLPGTPRTPTKRAPKKTPTRPTKKGKVPLRAPARAPKNLHIYFDED